jgi:hypothetical protein
MAAANAPGQGGANPVRALVDCIQREAPHAFTIDLLKAILLLVLSIALVAAGIGLLALHNWARWLSLGCAVLSILLHVSYLIFQLAIELPALRHCQAMVGQAAKTPGFQEGQAVGNVIGVMGVFALWVIYPIILFLLLLLPKVAEAFSPRPKKKRRRRRREEEYDDEEEFDDRRNEDYE